MSTSALRDEMNRLGWSDTPAAMVACYYAMRQTTSILEKYPDLTFHTAYLSLHDKLPNRFLGVEQNLPQLNSEDDNKLFDSFCAKVRPLSLQDFASLMFPNRIKNNRFFDVLANNSDNDYHQIYYLYVLLLISPTESAESAYQFYENKPHKNPLSKADFLELFYLMNWREVIDDTSIKASVKDAASLLSQMFITNEQKCSIASTTLDQLSKLQNKTIKHPSALLSKILYQDSKEVWYANASDLVDKFIKRLDETVLFSDILGVIMNGSKKRENLAECGFLLPWLKSVVPEKAPTCIVNATPVFLTRWGIQPQDSITVPFSNAVAPIKNEMKVSTYWTEKTKHIPFQSEQQIIYFDRNFSQEQVAAHLHDLCRENATVTAIMRDSFKGVLCSIPGYSVSQIHLLPSALFNRKNTKKYFAVKLTPTQTNEIFVTQFDAEKIKRHVYMCPAQRTYVSISRDDFFSNQSIRAIYRQALNRRKTAHRRTPPKSFAFSAELTLWYSAWKNEDETYKLRLYLCEVPTEKQKKRNKYPRGKLIKSTETWNTCIDSADIESWIEHKGAYHPKLRIKAIEQIRRYQGNELSLKTLFYCLADQLELSDEEKWNLQQLLQSGLGKLVIGRATQEEIEVVISSVSSSEDFLLSQLDTLFELAVKQRYIKKHPFEKLHALRIRQAKREESIRALAKRNYTEAEEAKILEYYKNNRNDGGALGMLIAFCTGLTTPYIAALTWKDLRKVTHTSHFQLVINKKKQPDGTIVWQTEEDACRLLPIMDFLSDELIAYKIHMAPVRDDEPMLNLSVKTESAIRKHIKKAETAAGIKSDTVGIAASERITDLNQYSGSRMRENFEHHCYIDCGLTDAEVHHLIMLTMPDTLSKNYVDYGHPCIQERMAVKLNQWGRKLQAEDDPGLKHIPLSKGPVLLPSTRVENYCYYLSTSVSTPLSIHAKCEHDFEYRIITSRMEDSL